MSMASVALPKCCPQGMSLFENSSKCQSTPDIDFRPVVYRLDSWRNPVRSPLDVTSYTYGIPACSKYLLRPEDDFYLMEDATIHFNNLKPVLGNFCVENFGPDVLPMVCFEDTDPGVPPEMMIVLPVGMVISIPFMLATVLVYALLPELRNFHGKTLICYVSSFIVSYTALAYIQLDTYLATTPCITFGFTIQYFFLAGFFWSSVMCIDIYCTFSGVRGVSGPGRSGDMKKFLKYSVYSWICPLLIVIATIVLDNTNFILPSSRFKPGIGNGYCFFEHDAARWLFFNGPIAIILAANCFMFSVTAWRIWSHTRQMKILKAADSRRHNKDKERFSRYLKLFVVMGVNWMAELLAWLLGGPHEFWYISDVTNTLQGVFVFVILVCKRRTLRLLKARLLKGKVKPQEGARAAPSSATGGQTSVTSDVTSSTMMDEQVIPLRSLPNQQ